MFIAIVDFTIAPEARQSVIDRLTHDRTAIRAMPGNIAFAPFIDPTDDSAVRVWHEWRDHDSFRAYTSSDMFRQLGLDLRPMMTAAPLSRRMTAGLVEATG